MNDVRMKPPLPVCAMCGMAAATFGGVVRDVFCSRYVRSLHLRAEIYATTALAGASGYLAARKAGLGAGGRVGLRVALAVGLSAWAWNHGVRLPIWEKETEKI